MRRFFVILLLLRFLNCIVASQGSEPVRLNSSAEFFMLENGILSAQIEKRSGVLVSLKYHGLETLAVGRRGSDGGYWSSVGRSRPLDIVGADVRRREKIQTYLRNTFYLIQAMFKPGILSNEDFQTTINYFVPDIQIEETRIPFRAVATDLVSGNEIPFFLRDLCGRR